MFQCSLSCTLIYLYVFMFTVLYKYIYVSMLRVPPAPRLAFLDGILISYLILILYTFVLTSCEMETNKLNWKNWIEYN